MQEADPAGEGLAALLQGERQLLRIANEEALGAIAQGQVDQRGELAADGEHLGDDADHRAARARASGLSRWA